MIVRTIKVFVLLLFITVASACSTTSSSSNKITEQKFQNAINAIYAKRPNAVGILVHVESPTRNISWSGATGFFSKDKTSLLSPNTPAWIASNTKTYMAVATLRLTEEGKFTVHTSIDKLLSENTLTVLRADGYQPETITIEHLLTHTSGVFDYASDNSYIEFMQKNPKYRWSRDLQITRAMKKGEPLGAAGDIFTYADTNYLLLSEIIERATGKEFYTAVRDLIDYEKQGMDHTWFLSLEDKPKNTADMAHQYVSEMKLHNYDMDPSFDLYGGGGLAATTKDLAIFSQNLFTGKIYKNPDTLTLMQTKANPKKKIKFEYLYGLSTIDVQGHKGIGHGGFWGTAVNYFPDLDMSLAVFILERDQRASRRDVNQAIVGILVGE